MLRLQAGRAAAIFLDRDGTLVYPRHYPRRPRDLVLDLGRSWLIGNILDDIEAGNRSGCRTVLVDLGTEHLPDDPVRRPDFVARDTQHALRIVAACTGLVSAVDLSYQIAGHRTVAPGAAAPRH